MITTIHKQVEPETRNKKQETQALTYYIINKIELMYYSCALSLSMQYTK